MTQFIANPIYDSAFKYMMQNERAATVLLENLLDKEILKLDILTNDVAIIEEKSGVRILRLDFSAKVRDRKTGETELVTIELQKSYLDTEIMRFRTYLGQQYSDIKKTDTETVKTWRKNKDTGKVENVEVEKHIPLHIIAIYILGHPFQEINIQKPVIYNRPNPRGIEKEPIPEVMKTRFFQGLTHDTIIVQIPYLKRNAKTKVEQILEIFCQDYVSSKTDQLLEIDDFDDRSSDFKDLARPLQFAASNPEIRKVMTIEDEMSIHFQNVKYVTDENEALHTMIEESRQKLQEKDSQLQKKDSQLQEKDSQLQEKDNQLASSIQMLSELGASPEQIAEKLKIAVDIVKRMLNA
ncbi:MAG: hypothetical protein II939_00830 [Bacteroidales bacterium]|nr:hypothetical protein [Bacteroidales bacterium]